MNARVKKIRKLASASQTEIHYLREVINNIPGSIYWKNNDGVYLGHNKFAAEKMRSVNLNDNIVGKTDYELFPKIVADEFRRNDFDVMKKRKTMSVEESTVVADNKVMQLSIKSPLYDKKGNVIGIMGNTIDITYLKKIESDLRVAKDKAEQANKAKTEFLNAAVKEIEEALNFKQKTKSEETKIYHEKIRQVLNDIKSFAKFDLIETNIFSTEDVGDSVKPLKVSGKALELFYEFYKKFMLTKREAECLYYLIRGLTVKHIARTINLSYRTVEFYLNNAKLKLNCRTKQALISKVFESGIV